MAILMDLSQIISATIYMGDAAECVKNPSLDSKNMVKHSVFNSIRSNNMAHKGRYGKLILACDNGSWRRDIFPQYKHSRRVKRAADTSGIDWNFVNEIKAEIYTELDKYFPFPIIHLPRVEGDDAIGVLCKHLTDNGSMSEDIFGNSELEEHLIISSDKDNYQLHALGKHIKQWSPMDKKLVKPTMLPNISLLEKIVRGDSGDGVPNIKMGNNTFVDGVRQKPISEKYLQTFYSAKSPIDSCLTEEEKVNFARNAQLVSYDEIPPDIKDAIILCYNEQLAKPHSKMALMNYLTSNKMSNILNSVHDFY